MFQDFYSFDLRSNIGHDLVMLSLWENFEIVPVLKIFQMSASLYYLCVTIPSYILICNSVFLGLSYFFRMRSAIRSREVAQYTFRQ